MGIACAVPAAATSLVATVKQSASFHYLIQGKLQLIFILSLEASLGLQVLSLH